MNLPLQARLTGALIRLEPLQPADFEAVYAVASDPLLWEQHPEPDRCTRPVFAKFFQRGIDSGGAYLVIDQATGEVIGSSRYSGYDEACEEIEIGSTFLGRAYWGGRYNRELKSLMLRHAFTFACSVVFRIGEKNLRSRKAIEKIGAELVDVPSRRLAGHVVYRITREEFERRNGS